MNLRFLSAEYLLITIGILLFSHSSSATEQLGIRALALSGAYRAIGADNDALYFNPGAITRPTRYGLKADYLFDITASRHLVGASIVDSRTSIVTAGIAYHLGIDPRDSATHLSHRARLALAIVPMEALSIGLEIKYLWQPAFEAEEASRDFTGDVGILASLPIGLSLASVAYNLIPVKNKELPMAFGAGAALALGRGQTAANGMGSGVILAFDWVMKDLLKKRGEIKHSLHAGAEALLFDLVPVRVGYQYQMADRSHSGSIGTGFTSSVVGLDLLYDMGFANNHRKLFGAAVNIYL